MDKKHSTNSTIGTFLETYRLMSNYHMIWYRKNFGGLDPQQGQGRILLALRRMNAITQKELGLLLDIRPQSLGELLQKLEANGYITRRRSPTDKRALVVELTEKGETFQMHRPEYEKIFQDLSVNEQVEFMQTLEKISKRLNELLEKETEDDFY